MELTREEKLLKLPPKSWEFCASKYTDSELSDIADRLTSLAERAALLAEYFEWRGGSGRGDHGHDRAVKAANKQRTKVRKALGYTMPEAGEFTW